MRSYTSPTGSVLPLTIFNSKIAVSHVFPDVYIKHVIIFAEQNLYIYHCSFNLVCL
jgi:hypothetical protein